MVRSNQKTLAINHEHKSRTQIANANREHKSRMQIAATSIQKTMAITCLKIISDRITEGCAKNNGDHSGGEILACFGVQHFCGPMTFLFSNLRYRGGLGPDVYTTKHQASIKFSIKYF